MIEYKSGEELSFMKKSPHSPECVSSMIIFGLAFCFIMPTLIVCVIEEYTESKKLKGIIIILSIALAAFIAAFSLGLPLVFS